MIIHMFKTILLVLFKTNIYGSLGYFCAWGGDGSLSCCSFLAIALVVGLLGYLWRIVYSTCYILMNALPLSLATLVDDGGSSCVVPCCIKFNCLFFCLKKAIIKFSLEMSSCSSLICACRCLMMSVIVFFPWSTLWHHDSFFSVYLMMTL